MICFRTRCSLFIRSVVLLFIGSISFGQTAQEYPFSSEIRAFEKADSVTPPPKNPIVFTGSSSIRFWENLSTYFPNKPLLQRGFGGSDLSQVLHYADRIIIPYHPKQVVLYAGENDIATGKQTGRQTFDRFVALFRYVRQKLPRVSFVFISIKPSPSRRSYFAEIDTANRLIERFLSRQRNARFVDIRPVMLQQNGQPVPALFKPDSLHMREEGYQRWAGVLRPYLK